MRRERRRLGARCLGVFLLLAAAVQPSPAWAEIDDGVQEYRGIWFKEIEVGDGPRVKKGHKVTVEVGVRLRGGTKIESASKRVDFRVGSGDVIKGLERGVVGMRRGGVRRLWIPPRLAYGDKGAGEIPPDATLIVEVKLRDLR